MEKGFAYKCIRILFIIFNFLGILMGVAMVAIGAYLYIEKDQFLNLMPKLDDINVTAVMIAAGIVVFIVAFVGFCGAWMESQCMLIMFFTAIFIIFAMEIAVGIIGFIYRNDVDSELKTQLEEGLKDSKRYSSWDSIQKEFSCCGVNNYEDWYGPLGGSRVPDSCCSFDGCGNRPDLVLYSGCYTKVKEVIEDNFYVLGAAGISLGVLQILLLVMTMVMLCAIRRNRASVA